MFKTIHKENPQNNAWHLLMSSFTHLAGASLWHFLFVAPGHTSKEHILWKGRHMSLWPIWTPKKCCFCGAFFWVAGFRKKCCIFLLGEKMFNITLGIIKLEENLSFFSIPCEGWWWWWWCTHKSHNKLSKLPPCFCSFSFRDKVACFSLPGLPSQESQWWEPYSHRVRL